MSWLLQAAQPSAGVYVALGLSVLYVVLFVGLMYAFMVVNPVANVSIHNRNHPRIIVRRTLGVLTCSVVSLALTAVTLRAWQKRDSSTNSIAADATGGAVAGGGGKGWLQVGEQLGLAAHRAPGSLVVGLVLTAVLYTGPLVLDYMDGSFTWANVIRFAGDLRTLRIKQRDYVVGPVSEELVFRASIVPLWLAAGIPPHLCIWLSPVLFGLAHLHQGYRLLAEGTHSVKQIIASTALQLAYTTVFGWFAVAVFIRTHSVAGPIAAHFFCNVQGLPDFGRVSEFQGSARYALWLAFGLGALGFALLFEPMTRPGVFV
ncbi:CAAX prenyl protease [Coemansia sp. Benny D160-2]|nr:CAAX prenyl protease [Coemansia sp. Benny D160-2]